MELEEEEEEEEVVNVPCRPQERNHIVEDGKDS